MRADNVATAPINWTGAVFEQLKAWQVVQVAYVPDAGHAELINRCDGDSEVRLVPLTTEEEGIAVLAGAWLGGQRGVLLMQSSGVGNCINMFGLMQTCRFPLAAFVTMRGQWNEFNPWQMPMGQGTELALSAMNINVETADNPKDILEKSAAVLHSSFVGNQMTALLLHQRLMPKKTFEN